ncbi:MAG: phage terminase small subunit P27 family [Proteobacteria bacterium]|nr:phage terminase small subunit P27 family [Pseudomonadota bacterium]
MARGRKGQSAEERAAKGNPGKRGAKATKGKTVPPLPPVSEATPAYLSAEGKKVWARVAPILAPMKFFRATDHEAMARYCENLQNWWAAERRLRRFKGDPTYETESKHGKMLRVHPLLTAQNAYEKRLIALEDRLGLSPKARQEILRGLASALPPLPPGPRDGELDLDRDAADPPPPSPIGILNPPTTLQ